MMADERMGREMAYLAHRAAIEEAAEIQQRMALREMTGRMHGPRTLPLREFVRRMARTGEALIRAPAMLADEAASDEKRLARLYEIIQSLESVFVRMHDASDAEFSRWAADHMAGRHD